MPNNYQVIDAYGSVLTFTSSVVSSSHQQVVQISSVLTPLPVTLSQGSVSGTVGSSIVGQLPAGTAVLGSVAALQGTNPWNIAGSVVSYQQGTIISSIVNSIPSSVLVGSSIFGQLPAGTAVLGSVAALQGSNPWDISGSVVSQQIGTRIASVVSSAPSSMLTGSSIFGMLPAGTQVLGSVATLQGTNPWNISSVYGNISGSVLAQQMGTQTTSVVGSIPSSLLTGNYGFRNDNVASFLGGNLSWNQIATDSAGRTLGKPFAAEEARVEGYASTVNTSQTTLIAAAGAGLRNYITDLWFANTGATTTLVTLKDGAGSVLGYTIAPTGSGSNLPGLQMPIRTGANATFDFQATTGTSVLYATVKGFKAP